MICSQSGSHIVPSRRRAKMLKADTVPNVLGCRASFSWRRSFFHIKSNQQEQRNSGNTSLNQWPT
jgi:hypothetical protein